MTISCGRRRAWIPSGPTPPASDPRAKAAHSHPENPSGSPSSSTAKNGNASASSPRPTSETDPATVAASSGRDAASSRKPSSVMRRTEMSGRDGSALALAERECEHEGAQLQAHLDEHRRERVHCRREHAGDRGAGDDRGVVARGLERVRLHPQARVDVGGDQAREAAGRERERDAGGQRDERKQDIGRIARQHGHERQRAGGDRLVEPDRLESPPAAVEPRPEDRARGDARQRERGERRARPRRASSAVEDVEHDADRRHLVRDARERRRAPEARVSGRTAEPGDAVAVHYPGLRPTYVKTL